MQYSEMHAALRPLKKPNPSLEQYVLMGVVVVTDYEMTVTRREFYITYINPSMRFEALVGEIKDTCRFSPKEQFTVKWVDEEGKRRHCCS